MQKRLLKISLALLLLSSFELLSACGSITIKDKPVCVEITPTRGSCTKMVSGQQFDVDETHPLQDETDGKLKTWWEMRPVMLQMPPDTWAYIKSLVILTCKKTGKCKDKEIESWNRTAGQVDSDLAKRKGTK